MLLKYIIFAILATLLNTITQFLIFNIYFGSFKLYIAILAGTLVGLIFKYFLDRRYVFNQNITLKMKREATTFSLYSLMGVITTIVYWCIEILFDYMIDYYWSKYLGAVIGLGVGYTIKFYLDKNFVFD